MKRNILLLSALLCIAFAKAQLKVGPEVGSSINGIIPEKINHSTKMMNGTESR